MTPQSVVTRTLFFTLSILACHKGFSQTEELKVTKPISSADAKSIQAILNKMDASKMALVTQTTDGKTFVYGKPRGMVVAGRPITSIQSYEKTAMVHSTVKDFFLGNASLQDKAQLQQLKAILSKYN